MGADGGGGQLRGEESWPGARGGRVASGARAGRGRRREVRLHRTDDVAAGSYASALVGSLHRPPASRSAASGQDVGPRWREGLVFRRLRQPGGATLPPRAGLALIALALAPTSGPSMLSAGWQSKNDDLLWNLTRLCAAQRWEERLLESWDRQAAVTPRPTRATESPRMRRPKRRAPDEDHRSSPHPGPRPSRGTAVPSEIQSQVHGPVPSDCKTIVRLSHM